ASIAFSNPTTERNLIYLVPLAFVALVVWFDATGVRIAPLVVSAVAVTGALLWIPLRFPPYPASHAPSFAVLAKAHQLGWTRADMHAGLVAAAAIATLVLFFLPRARSSPGQIGRLAIPVVCGVILVWTLAAELQSNASAASYSKLLAATLPRPLDWVDRTTNGQRTIHVRHKVAPHTAL